MLPEFPEDAYPSVPEMEPLKEELNNYLLMWKNMEQIITENLIQILTLDISNKTPKELLQKVVETMESKAPCPVFTVKSRHSHWKHVRPRKPALLASHVNIQDIWRQHIRHSKSIVNNVDFGQSEQVWGTLSPVMMCGSHRELEFISKLFVNNN